MMLICSAIYLVRLFLETINNATVAHVYKRLGKLTSVSGVFRKFGITKRWQLNLSQKRTNLLLLLGLVLVSLLDSNVFDLQGPAEHDLSQLEPLFHLHLLE